MPLCVVLPSSERRLQGRLPIRPDFRYLDVGCGKGDIAVALLNRGVESVIGIDIMERNVASAKANAQRERAGQGVQFVCEDIDKWKPPHKFNVVLSHEALEHIENPQGFLAKLADFVEPSGIVVLAFGPLFFSPFGDHMDGFFRVPVPWRGLLFSERAILPSAASDTGRPTVASLRDIVGHLNLMRYSEFLRWVDEAGWTIDYIAVNPQLKKLPPLHWLSCLLTRIPGLAITSPPPSMPFCGGSRINMKQTSSLQMASDRLFLPGRGVSVSARAGNLRLAKRTPNSQSMPC